MSLYAGESPTRGGRACHLGFGLRSRPSHRLALQGQVEEGTCLTVESNDMLDGRRPPRGAASAAGDLCLSKAALRYGMRYRLRRWRGRGGVAGEQQEQGGA